MLIRAAAGELDALADGGPFEEALAHTVDPKSAIYMAAERARLSLERIGLSSKHEPGMMTLLGDLWLDAFIVGACYEKGRAARESKGSVRS